MKQIYVLLCFMKQIYVLLYLWNKFMFYYIYGTNLCFVMFMEQIYVFHVSKSNKERHSNLTRPFEQITKKYCQQYKYSAQDTTGCVGNLLGTTNYCQVTQYLLYREFKIMLYAFVFRLTKNVQTYKKIQELEL